VEAAVNIGFALYGIRRLRASKEEAYSPLPNKAHLDYAGVFLNEVTDALPSAAKITILTPVTNEDDRFDYGTPEDARDLDVTIVFHAMEPMIGLEDIPRIRGEGYVKPLQSASLYLSKAARAFNSARRTVQVLDDARGVRYGGKARDFRWPWRVLANGQARINGALSYRFGSNLDPPSGYDWSNTAPGCWVGPDMYRYAGLDLLGLRDYPAPDLEGRHKIGLLGLERDPAVGKFMLDLVRSVPQGVEVLGRWPTLGIDNVVPVEDLIEATRDWRAAFVYPSITNGTHCRQFVTLKSWEMAAFGIVPIAVNGYDPNGLTPALQTTPMMLDTILGYDEVYRNLATYGRKMYERRFAERPYVSATVSTIRRVLGT
jgi:hypothetical protein